MPKIDRNVWVLDSAVTLAPLMGLLGTIIGMVHAFGILGEGGVAGAAAQMVTGGIAEALVATGVGCSSPFSQSHSSTTSTSAAASPCIRWSSSR